MKKILSLAICIALIMISCSIVSITATAAENVIVNVDTGAEYTALADAFNACETGQTLKLLADIKAPYLGGNTSHKMGRTIDLDGHTLTCSETRFISPGAGTGNWSVDVKNGTLTSEGKTDFQSFAMVRANSSVTFENMIIREGATSRPSGYGFIATITDATGVLNFKNCTIYECATNTTQSYNKSGSTVNMYNTTVESYTSIFYTNSTYNVYSGTFTALGDADLATPTIASTSSAKVNEAKKLVVECNHNYVDGVCEYCFADKPASAGPEIVMDSGAAMRIDNATDGIRFSATVDKTALDEFGYTVTDAGMLVAKESAASAETLTVDNSVSVTSADQTIADGKVLSARYNGVTLKTAEDANKYVIIGSLIEISEKNANQKYVARAFIEYTDAEGQKAYLYSDLSTARSIAEVASLIQQEGLAKPADDTVYYNSLCGTHKDVVDFWAEKYSS